MNLRQKIVVVIGGSSGVGYEIARQTSALGAHLTVVGATKPNSPLPPLAVDGGVLLRK